jgi:hypothetical protein
LNSSISFLIASAQSGRSGLGVKLVVGVIIFLVLSAFNFFCSVVRGILVVRWGRLEVARVMGGEGSRSCDLGAGCWGDEGILRRWLGGVLKVEIFGD